MQGWHGRTFQRTRVGPKLDGEKLRVANDQTIWFLSEAVLGKGRQMIGRFAASSPTRLRPRSESPYPRSHPAITPIPWVRGARTQHDEKTSQPFRVFDVIG